MQTSDLYTRLGIVHGMGIQVMEHDILTGVIIFKPDIDLLYNNNFTGILTVMRFKALVTGDSNVVLERGRLSEN
jgi:hypothetical protein